jgi:hypothetical protein
MKGRDDAGPLVRLCPLVAVAFRWSPPPQIFPDPPSDVASLNSKLAATIPPIPAETIPGFVGREVADMRSRQPIEL